MRRIALAFALGQREIAREGLFEGRHRPVHLAAKDGQRRPDAGLAAGREAVQVGAPDEHRARTEKIWRIPEGTIPPKPGFDAVAQSRALKDGKLRVYWTQVTNNAQAGPNLMQELLPGWRNPDTFIIVSDVYPTPTTDVAATVAQVQACAEAGADIVRISVPDEASSAATEAPARLIKLIVIQ